MILELAVGAGIGAVVLLALGRYRARKAPESAIASAKTPRLAKPHGELALDDVVSLDDADHWIVGELKIDDGGEPFRLLHSSDGVFFLQIDGTDDRLSALRPTDQVPAGSVPDRLPIGPFGLSLWRRSTGRCTTTGAVSNSETPTLPAGPCHYTLMNDSSGRVLVVLDAAGARLPLLGQRLDPSSYVVFPGEGTTQGQ